MFHSSVSLPGGTMWIAQWIKLRPVPLQVCRPHQVHRLVQQAQICLALHRLPKKMFDAMGYDESPLDI